MKKNNEITDLIRDLENLESMNEKVTSLLNENLTWLNADGVEADNIAIIDGTLYDVQTEIVLKDWKIRFEFTRISPCDNIKFAIVVNYKETADSLFNVYSHARSMIPEELTKMFDIVKSEIASNPDEKEDEYI